MLVLIKITYCREGQ